MYPKLFSPLSLSALIALVFVGSQTSAIASPRAATSPRASVPRAYTGKSVPVLPGSRTKKRIVTLPVKGHGQQLAITLDRQEQGTTFRVPIKSKSGVPNHLYRVTGATAIRVMARISKDGRHRVFNLRKVPKHEQRVFMLTKRSAPQYISLKRMFDQGAQHVVVKAR